MNSSAEGDWVAHPLFQAEGGGSTPASALSVRSLVFEPCAKSHAVALCRRWHSRLPNVQRGPWQYAFHARSESTTVAVALWNNPSTRSLPSHWLELRRMACAPDRPLHTASAFLAWMVRWFKQNASERERCISYQDTAVHRGTMYSAAGWVPAYTGNERVRDRSGKRVGTDRMYRWNTNGADADASAKVRWEKRLTARQEPPQ